jgi:mycothiol system anti-sigma-R factor
MAEKSCDEVLEELETYLDGELSYEEGRTIEQHLADCSPCLQRQGFLTRLRGVVRETCGSVEELPDDLADRIRRAIAAEPRGPEPPE